MSSDCIIRFYFTLYITIYLFKLSIVGDLFNYICNHQRQNIFSCLLILAQSAHAQRWHIAIYTIQYYKCTTGHVKRNKQFHSIDKTYCLCLLPILRLNWNSHFSDKGAFPRFFFSTFSVLFSSFTRFDFSF